ncbi:MAG: hypothetical protein KAJ10_16100, partial [Thermodesulfovibrionia bacterium]|nr:hypothetical protein [Thermodesulfovibrionia bacterium]
GEKMNVTFENLGNVGVFTFNGEITSKHEDDLKIILMKAIHSIDRAILNFKEVTGIDSKCIQLFKRAYCASIRLKNPVILTEIPRNYLSEIFNCKIKNNINYSPDINMRSDCNKPAYKRERSTYGI